MQERKIFKTYQIEIHKSKERQNNSTYKILFIRELNKFRNVRQDKEGCMKT